MKLNDTYLQRRETEPAKPRSVQRVVRRLIGKYEKKRAKYYRWSRSATHRNDFESQLVYGALQLAYTEAQTDLESLFEPSNEEVSHGGDNER